MFDLPGAARGARPAAQPGREGRRGRHAARPRRSPRACCSTGSRRTCTRATPRWPSGAPRRWRWIATCCATCSAPRSCASCSTRRVLADVELELQCLADGRRARSPDELHDVLRKVGDLAEQEADLRCEGDGRAWLAAAGARAPGGARRRRRRGALDRRRGRRPLPRRARLQRCRSACRRRSPSRCRIPLESLVARFAAHAQPVRHRRGAPAASASRPSASPARSTALEAEDRLVRGEFRPQGSGREWCDVDVLRQLRRRSLAMLRREVEPVEPEAYARFVAGVARHPRRAPRAGGAGRGARPAAGRRARGLHAGVRGARRPAWPAYRPVDLDELCTRRRRVGRRRRARRQRRPGAAVLRRPAPAARRLRRATPTDPTGALHDAIRAQLEQRGASFWHQLRAAAPACHRGRAARRAVGPGVGRRGDQRLARPAAGDARLEAPRPSRPPAHAAPAGPDPGRLNRIGPPAGAGRWSLVEPLLPPAADRDARRPTPRPLQLLERYGVVTREAVLAEGVVGGFASVYGVLKVLEERGQVRRGYFVDRPRRSAVRRPRRGRPAACRPRARPTSSCTPSCVAAPVVLAATDPAQPYGAAMPWPDIAGSPGAHGRRARRAARRRPAGVVRPSLRPRRHLPGDGARPGLGRGAGHAGEGRPGPFSVEVARSTASRSAPSGEAAAALARRRLHRVLPRLRRALVTDDDGQPARPASAAPGRTQAG